MITELHMDALYSEARQIIESSRANAVRSVDFCRVPMYWQLGKRIFDEEQKGKERADYGAYILQNLAKRLEPEFGSGFSYRQLKFCRQFYRTYPIGNALRSQLNWTQYRLLIRYCGANDIARGQQEYPCKRIQTVPSFN